LEYDSDVSAVDLSFACHLLRVISLTVRMEKQEMNLGDGEKIKELDIKVDRMSRFRKKKKKSMLELNDILIIALQFHIFFRLHAMVGS
jgi:hypothetical protein